jgi:hypothetical protein
VRCGRCDEIFLASRHLLDEAAGAAVSTTSNAPPLRVPDRRPSSPPELDEPRIPPLEPTPLGPTFEDERHPALAGGTDVNSSDGHGFEATPSTDLTPLTPALATASAAADDPPIQAGDALQPTEHAPSTSEDGRQAHSVSGPNPSDRTGRYSWEQPARIRRTPSGTSLAAWTAVLALALTVLAGQAVHTWRDHLAAAVPAARPLLQVWCTLAGCRIEPLRRIGSISVESSQLRQLGGTIYRLEVVVRNRSELPLMMPSLDLALSDARGQLMARKALELTQFGLRTRVLGAGQELAILASVNAGTTDVAGYTVELFHP